MAGIVTAFAVAGHLCGQNKARVGQAGKDVMWVPTRQKDHSQERRS